MIEKLDPAWVVAFDTMPSIAEDLRSQLSIKVQGLLSKFGTRLEQWPHVQQHAERIDSHQADAVGAMLQDGASPWGVGNIIAHYDAKTL